MLNVNGNQLKKNITTKLCKKCRKKPRMIGRRLCLSCVSMDLHLRQKEQRAKKKEREALRKLKRRERRENNTRLLKKKLDVLFSQFIRQRDKKCVRCGTTQNLQCSHIMSRVSLKLRWDERNALTLCYKCHLTWWHKEPLEASEWCKTVIGEINYKDLLREKHEVKQWTAEELKEMIKKYTVDN